MSTMITQRTSKYVIEYKRDGQTKHMTVDDTLEAAAAAVRLKDSGAAIVGMYEEETTRYNLSVPLEYLVDDEAA